MNIFKKNKTYFIVISLFLLLTAFFVSAQERGLEVQYPKIGGLQPKTVSFSPQEYIKYIFNLSLWFIGAMAFGALILGGVRFLTSIGNPSKRTDAKNQITVVFLGAAILLGSYFILYSINPQLTVLRSEEIKKVEIIPADLFELPKVTTSINVELPIETMLKEDTYGLFGISRKTRIKNITDETVKIADDSKDLSCKLEKTAAQCKCSFGCDREPGCTTPICISDEESCELICSVNEDGEESCECINHSCYGSHCTSDPCCEVRDKLTEIKGKNIINISKFQEQNKKTKEEIISTKTMTEKIQKTLEIMKDDCSISGVLSRDQFISLKDYYIKKGEKLKKIQYWDEFESLIPSSQADFYCPIGGNQSSYIPESDFSEENIEEYNKKFLDYILLGGEPKLIMDCPRPVPFGEIIDESLSIANNLIEKMEELGKLQNEMIKAIDTLHIAISGCTSNNCSPCCDCECCDSGCSCTGCNCKGNACPPISTAEIEAINNKISQTQENIEEIINEIIPNFLNGPFQDMAEKIHSCIADPTEIEPGWLLLNCEKTIGAIGPEGKIFEETDECKISNDCDIIENCYEYNFFCCRIKD